MGIWHIFPRSGIMYQEKSGNPDGEALGLNGLVRLEESADL
jgi:hypothetical protein